MIQFLYRKLSISLFVSLISFFLIFFVFSTLNNLSNAKKFIDIISISLINSLQIINYVPSVIFIVAIFFLTTSFKSSNELVIIKSYFNKNLLVPGSGDNLNAELERAGRVRDFLDFGELLCRDALERNESCGGHFREEHQTEDGEALRDDENFAHAAVWEFKGDGKAPNRHQEKLTYDNVKLAVRSYK